MEKHKILELVLKRLPCSQQIEEIDLTSDHDAIRFTWRDDRLRISKSLSVEQVKGSALCGSNLAKVIEQLLKNNQSY